MLNGSLRTGAAKDSRDVRDCADLRLLVTVFAWHYRLFIRQFFREDDLEAFLDSHVAQALADYVSQRAVK